MTSVNEKDRKPNILTPHKHEITHEEKVRDKFWMLNVLWVFGSFICSSAALFLLLPQFDTSKSMLYLIFFSLPSLNAFPSFFHFFLSFPSAPYIFMRNAFFTLTHRLFSADRHTYTSSLSFPFTASLQVKRKFSVFISILNNVTCHQKIERERHQKGQREKEFLFW